MPCASHSFHWDPVTRWPCHRKQGRCYRPWFNSEIKSDGELSDPPLCRPSPAAFFFPNLANTCELARSTVGPQEVTSPSSVTAATLMPTYMCVFLDPGRCQLSAGGAESLLDVSPFNRSFTVLISLPTNYSQLLCCLQISFVTLLIIFQHSIVASTF